MTRVLLILAAILLPSYVQADDSTMRCGVEGPRGDVRSAGGKQAERPLQPIADSCTGESLAGIESGHRSVESSWKLLALYGSASAADLLSTEYGLARNAREGNPLMQNRAVRIGTQAGIVVLMTVATRHAQKTGHPNRAKVLKWGFLAVKGALFVHNVRQAGRQR